LDLTFLASTFDATLKPPQHRYNATIAHLGSILVLALLVAIVVGVAAARQLKWKLAAAAVVACVIIAIWGLVLMWNTGRDMVKPWNDAAAREAQ
jgi:undecaprenyl pyrophosphate phosphatase UppP